METAPLIGALATLCSTTSFAPQAWKIIASRDTQSISGSMYSITVAGFALWLAYGVAKSEWPLIVTNGICLAFASFILVMKLLPQKQKEAVADSIDSPPLK
jgi:MtN3 and saliva related transmembrane protein